MAPAVVATPLVVLLVEAVPLVPPEAEVPADVEVPVFDVPAADLVEAFVVAFVVAAEEVAPPDDPLAPPVDPVPPVPELVRFVPAVVPVLCSLPPTIPINASTSQRTVVLFELFERPILDDHNLNIAATHLDEPVANLSFRKELGRPIASLVCPGRANDRQDRRRNDEMPGGRSANLGNFQGRRTGDRIELHGVPHG